MDNTFRIVFKTKDGILVKNRQADLGTWFPFGKLDKEFADQILANEAREKGVRIVSYKATVREGVEAIVEWL